MVEYIYFVKCPNCEDEHFDFFDEAKAFALGCLSQKPVITQTEVCRNDFGECTDHSDLGQVWSWEDECRDCGYTKAEPAQSIFTKDDLKLMADGKDPEFDNIDNSINFEPEESVISEISAIDQVPDNFRKPTGLKETYYAVIEVDGEERRFPFDKREDAREYLEYVRAGKDPGFKGKKIGSTYTESCRKPVPYGMTIKQLVEKMEENEDTVECACCFELFSKEDCKLDEKHGWICSDCQEEAVECTWCNELYDHSQCRYEVDLGWLCDRCEAAIKSRGETLTFREGSYWDFLDEDASSEKDLANPESSDQVDSDVKTKSMLEELEEADAYRERLALCPECSNTSFDIETGICINCGFN